VYQFHLSLPLPEDLPAIDHQTPVLCLGSCFAKHIANRLAGYKFPTLLNPFGILYNPVSLARALYYLAGARGLREEELFEHQSLWRHFDCHSSLAQPKREQAWEQLKSRLEQGRVFLQRADRILLTLGTAFAYEERSRGEVVGNCHKLLARRFRKFRLPVEEVVQALGPALQACRKLRPELQVLLTVSPVRHLRDGILANQRSKAVLLLAAEVLCESPWIHYFPSYEIMMDELRDYRFYARDWAHPSEEAVDYIWQRFSSAVFEQNTKELNREIDALVRASRHRPQHPDTPAHRRFVEQQMERIRKMEQRHPQLDFSPEKSRLWHGGRNTAD